MAVEEAEHLFMLYTDMVMVVQAEEEMLAVRLGVMEQMDWEEEAEAEAAAVAAKQNDHPRLHS